ncbi:flagellar hook-associated protein FlgK [Robertmurraya yapensis]|uniref:Flagellar hook-associated protein 1 n=1 Tax=Bacillus yapensis TaxID=2492960 RepID=A0A431WM83_9BACI|nr:flagellar hook-associated protein FlgK [Bacillus yapensis]RTR36375.1 flagellar hook-associated protein FlgK [Bacillus yapensis]TKT05879.1 flagellar hook-associated protein FlgK [Bacillus yapensis]
MRSTFMGLETARRGMFAQQTALYVTGNNISNANTDGYSRQRVNLTQTLTYPGVGMNRPQTPGQLGTGVVASSIQRIRDEFVDSRYRGENNKLGYYSTKADTLSRMEEILNEPTEEGLAASLSEFWNSLQILGSSPNESGARESVLAQANALADTFNYMSTSLETIMEDLKLSTKANVDTINSIATQINEINRQISEVEPHGDLPNNLYDERDKLVDELSALVNIKVTKEKTGGNASILAEGVYKIEILGSSGNSLGVLVDKNSLTTGPTQVSTSADYKSIIFGSSTVALNDFSMGELKANMEALTDKYPAMIENLDNMAYTLVKEFNKIHSDGDDLNGDQGSPFFNDLTTATGAAKSISVAITDPTKIAAAADGTSEGNGDNAYSLAGVMTKNLTDFTTSTIGTTGNFQSFYAGVIASLGVQTKESNVLTNNTLTLLDSVNTQRQSVSSVSLDEEMTDMIKFQHAYNASARMITMIDETLDKIVNGLGVGGR